MTTDNAKLSDAELEELEAHFKKPIRAVDLPLFVVDLLPRLLAMAKDSEHWKRMYECAQNANSFRADAIEKAESISKAAPDMVLVPREPTRDMLHAAVDVDAYKLGDISPLGFRCSPQQLFERCWDAMLAAAPKADKEGK